MFHFEVKLEFLQVHNCLMVDFDVDVGSIQSQQIEKPRKRKHQK